MAEIMHKADRLSAIWDVTMGYVGLPGAPRAAVRLPRVGLHSCLSVVLGRSYHVLVRTIAGPAIGLSWSRSASCSPQHRDACALRAPQRELARRSWRVVSGHARYTSMSAAIQRRKCCQSRPKKGRKRRQNG